MKWNLAKTQKKYSLVQEWRCDYDHNSIFYLKKISQYFFFQNTNIRNIEINLYTKEKKFQLGPVLVQMSSRASLTSWGEGASLALLGNPSSDGVTIKMPYGVDVLHWPVSNPIFSYWVV